VETRELIASKGEQGHYSYLKALRNINMNFLHGSTALVGLGFLLCRRFEITLRQPAVGRTPPYE